MIIGAINGVLAMACAAFFGLMLAMGNQPVAMLCMFCAVTASAVCFVCIATALEAGRR